MAKKQHTTDEAPASGESATNPERILVIQGVTFSVAPRYAEGHQLTAHEATALNGLLGENLRNNFSTTVKKLVEAQPKDEAGNPVPLSDEQITALRAQFAEYASSYAFSGARATRAPVDPVEREARKMARVIITNALKGKSIDPKTLADGKMDELIDAVLAKQPAIRARAKEYVDSLAKLSTDALGDLAA